MDNVLNVYRVTTIAFSVFLKNHDSLQKFCALNFDLNVWAQYENTDPIDLSVLPEHEVLPHVLADIGSVGKTLAISLAIVYLAAIMEAYVQDAIEDITNRRIREIGKNYSPSVGRLASAQVKAKLRQTPVKNGVDLLTEYFQATIKDKDVHLLNWREIKLRRNCIVHNNGRANRKYVDFVRGTKSSEIVEEDDLLTTDPDYVREAIRYVHDFARDIEQSLVEIYPRI